jgi:hypothetical protein
MSAPYVSALAGLLYSYYPQFTYSQVRATILRYVDPLPALQGRVLTGGRINAYKALSSLLMPTNLTATASTSSTISLAWTDNATGEDGYAVERDSGSGFGQVATLAPNATTHTDSGLGSSATYTYRVRAFNTIPASSSYSNIAYATTPASTPAPPPPPSGGGGGCSVGSVQNMPTTTADITLLLIPFVMIVLVRWRR